jgi:magnesium transporter
MLSANDAAKEAGERVKSLIREGTRMVGLDRWKTGRLKIQIRKRTAPGAPPGTMSVDPTASPAVIRVMAYGPDRIHEETVTEPEKVADFLAQWPVTWVDVTGLGNGGVIQRLGDLFNIHPLALADVVHVHQRPKVEEYDEQLFIVSRMITLKEGHLDSEQFSLFLGKNFVVTFQERPGDCLDPVRERIRKGTGRIRGCGPDYLAYALLDAIVDHYFPVLEAYGEQLEALEDRVILRPGSELISQVHEIKRQLLAIRRAIWPQREAMNVLMRGETSLVTEETRIYLRDCYDHTIQIVDLLENYREIASGLTDLYLSSLSNRMNEVMKVLAIFATLFIPLTFIAGIYGMNFDTERSPWNLPELGWYFGYPFALGLMVATAIALLVYFRRKGWLGSSPASPTDEGSDTSTGRHGRE